MISPFWGSSRARSRSHASSCLSCTTTPHSCCSNPYMISLSHVFRSAVYFPELPAEVGTSKSFPRKWIRETGAIKYYRCVSQPRVQKSTTVYSLPSLQRRPPAVSLVHSLLKLVHSVRPLHDFDIFGQSLFRQFNDTPPSHSI